MTEWATEMNPIARDLSLHCSAQVAEAMQRTLALCTERGEFVAVATAGVIAALQVARGAFAGLMDVDIDSTTIRDVAEAVVSVMEEART